MKVFHILNEEAVLQKFRTRSPRKILRLHLIRVARIRSRRSELSYPGRTLEVQKESWNGGRLFTLEKFHRQTFTAYRSLKMQDWIDKRPKRQSNKLLHRFVSWRETFFCQQYSFLKFWIQLILISMEELIEISSVFSLCETRRVRCVWWRFHLTIS